VSKNLGRGLVALFVVVDIILVVAMMRHVNKVPASSTLSSVSGSTETAKASPTPTHSAQDPYRFVPAQSSSISLANDQTLVYASRGQCNGDAAAKLVISSNEGASTSTSQIGLKEIVAVSAVSRSEIHVVGATADCTVKKLISSDGGDTWTPDSSGGVWYPSIDDATSVVSPSGASKPGCTVTSLSQIGEDFARVSCSDGSIRGTGNGGQKWFKLGRLDNVRVAAFSTFNAGYALAVYQGCAAQEFTTRDSGRTWAAGGCISGEPAQAIAANDTSLVAVVASQLYTSDNGGLKWAQP
jgi:hypothetical protein